MTLRGLAGKSGSCFEKQASGRLCATRDSGTPKKFSSRTRMRTVYSSIVLVRSCEPKEFHIGIAGRTCWALNSGMTKSVALLVDAIGFLSFFHPQRPSRDG